MCVPLDEQTATAASPPVCRPMRTGIATPIDQSLYTVGHARERPYGIARMTLTSMRRRRASTR